MDIQMYRKLYFDDVSILPKPSLLDSRKEVNLYRSFTTKHGGHLEGIPVIASNRGSMGNFRMSTVLSSFHMFTAISKQHEDNWHLDAGLTSNLLYSFYTITIRDPEEIDQYLSVYVREEPNPTKTFPVKLIIETANAYSVKNLETLTKAIERVREKHPNVFIIAGNVITHNQATNIIRIGADAVKLGMTATQRNTGINFPQFSMLTECVDSVHREGGLVVLDGGCRNFQDICKAFCAGADFVMSDYVFAGTHECDGLTHARAKASENAKGEIVKSLYEYKYLYDEYYENVQNYEVPYKGSVSDVAINLIDALRSLGTFINADSIADFHEQASFIQH